VNKPSAAANLAALIESVAADPGARVLNGADPGAPTALEIARTIAGYLGHDWEEVLLDEPAGPVGRHPWDVPHPVILDTSAAAALGYVPAGDYAATVTAEVDWLVRAASAAASTTASASASAGVANDPESAVLSGLDDEFFSPMLDYAAEDRYYAGSQCG
jgi:hypothetical protein